MRPLIFKIIAIRRHSAPAAHAGGAISRAFISFERRHSSLVTWEKEKKGKSREKRVHAVYIRVCTFQSCRNDASAADITAVLDFMRRGDRRCSLTSIPSARRDGISRSQLVSATLSFALSLSVLSVPRSTFTHKNILNSNGMIALRRE